MSVAVNIPKSIARDTSGAPGHILSHPEYLECNCFISVILGRDLRQLINTVHNLTGRGVGLNVLSGHGATIDTTTAAGKLVFGIFAALAEFERELIAERTTAGLASARARGRNGGCPYKRTPVKLRLAMASMGELRLNGIKLLKRL